MLFPAPLGPTIAVSELRASEPLEMTDRRTAIIGQGYVAQDDGACRANAHDTAHQMASHSKAEANAALPSRSTALCSIRLAFENAAEAAEAAGVR